MKTKPFALFLPLFALAACGGGESSSSVTSRVVFTDEKGMSYEQYEDGWHLTDYRGEDKNVIVPETKTIGDLTLKVTQIEANAFYGRDYLDGIEIPSSIVSIGDSAFYGTNLSAFYGSVNLKNVASNAFDETPFLKNAKGPILYLPTRDNPYCVAYKQLSTVSNYEIPATVERALPEVFARASFAENNPEFPALKYVGARAFAKANFEYTITLTAAIEIGEEAFAEVPATAVNMPAVESLGDHAFKNASFLTSVKMNKELKSMGQGAFDGCYAMKTINLPFIGPDGKTAKGLTYVFGQASDVKADPTQGGYKVILDTLEITGGQLTDDVSEGIYGFKSLIIDNVQDIPPFAFQNHGEMTSLILSNVQNIQYSAFYNHKLSSVYISSAVVNIYDKAFYSTGAYSMSFEYTAWGVSQRVGYHLSSLDVGDKATFYYGVANPYTSKEKTSADGNWKYSVSENGFATIISYLGTNPELTLPLKVDDIKVTRIADTLFEDNHVVTSLTIPKDVPAMDDHSLGGAHNLKKLELYDVSHYLARQFSLKEFQNSYPVIRSYTGYSGDYNQTTYIPSSLEEIIFHVKEIRESYCASFSSLKKVTFAENGVNAGENAFYGCSSVVEVYIPKNSSCAYKGLGFGPDTIVRIHNSNPISSWNSFWTESKHIIKVDDSGQSIEFVFSVNSKKGYATLTSYQGEGGEVTIPTTYNGYPVTTIGGSAFKEFGDKITSLIVPNSITDFTTTCLTGCRNLEKIIVPFCGLTQAYSSYRADYMFVSLFGDTEGWGGNTEGLYSSGNGSLLPSSLKRIRVTDQTSFKYKSFEGIKGVDDLILPEETTSLSGDFIYNGDGVLKRLYIGDKLTTTLGNAIPGNNRNITLYTAALEGEINVKTYDSSYQAVDLFQYPPVYGCSLEQYLTLFPW